MTLSLKKITGTVIAAAVIASSFLLNPITVSASYIDGDREVDYYGFRLNSSYIFSDDWYAARTDPIKKRFVDREWVVTVESVSFSNPNCALIYGVSNPSDYSMPIATTTTMQGTGNSGGRFYQGENYYKDKYLVMTVNKTSSMPSGTIIQTSGQWSPDAPW